MIIYSYIFRDQFEKYKFQIPTQCLDRANEVLSWQFSFSLNMYPKNVTIGKSSIVNPQSFTKFLLG